MKTQTTKKIHTIPPTLQGVLWSVNVKNLDLKIDKIYIIHQVLSYGNLQQIRWLFRVYSEEEIRKIFETSPMKIYNFPTFNFIKNIVLDLKEKSLPSKKYVSSIY